MTHISEISNYNYFPQVDQVNKEDMARIRKVQNILFRRGPTKNTRSRRIRLRTEDFILEREIPAYFKEDWKKYLNRIPVTNNVMKKKVLK